LWHSNFFALGFGTPSTSAKFTTSRGPRSAQQSEVCKHGKAVLLLHATTSEDWERSSYPPCEKQVSAPRRPQHLRHIGNEATTLLGVLQRGRVADLEEDPPLNRLRHRCRRQGKAHAVAEVQTDHVDVCALAEVQEGLFTKRTSRQNLPPEVLSFAVFGRKSSVSIGCRLRTHLVRTTGATGESSCVYFGLAYEREPSEASERPIQKVWTILWGAEHLRGEGASAVAKLVEALEAPGTRLVPRQPRKDHIEI